MRAPDVRLVPLLILVTLTVCSGISRVLAIQDIVGGASQILMDLPKNPPVRRKPDSTRTPPSSQPDSHSPGTNDGDKNRRAGDLSDEVEDALALGNSARDAKPPRFEDAQKAYQLAAKLNPKDPRPYVGLANIWYDQKHFEEAARKYREAVQLMASNNPAIGGNSSGKPTVRGKSGGATAVERGQLRAYLGNALLHQGQFSEAEVEFRNAVADVSNNAQWHALLGYSLLQQKKYPEATASLRRALQLSPKNAEYQELLKQSLDRQPHQ